MTNYIHPVPLLEVDLPRASQGALYAIKTSKESLLLFGNNVGEENSPAV